MDDDEEYEDVGEDFDRTADGDMEEEERNRKTRNKDLIVDPGFAAFHFAPKKLPPKKITIKRFRAVSTNCEKDASDSPAAPKNRNDCIQHFTDNRDQWDILSESVNAIQNMQKVNRTYEHLYEIVESICLNSRGLEIYNKLVEKIHSHLVSECKLLMDRPDFDGVILLRSVDTLWDRYCAQMDGIQSIFLYLDRGYVLHDRSLQPIYDTGLTVFNEVALQQFGLGPRVGKYAIELITAERSGQKVDVSLLRSNLRMLHNLNVYEQYFEAEFLATTSKYYREESGRLVNELEAPSYLHHISFRLSEERSRCDVYIVHRTRNALLTLVEKELIEQQLELLVKKGTSILLDTNNREGMQLMYDLVGKVQPSRQTLRTEFSDYIKKVGKALVTDPARDSMMVKDLMDFKKKIDECINSGFGYDEKFAQSAKDSFDYFINTRPNKPAELIAKFMDARLRAGNKESSEEELDDVMDQAVHIFRFIQGKDVFEAFYKKDLAKRLLLGRSASVDAEKAMLSKLRQECGPGFTHKLEGMFKDMDLSQSLAIAFKQYCSSHQIDLRPDLTVNVLTMGMWPKYEPSEVIISSDLGGCLQSFNTFYTQKHNGRKLQWQHSLGQALLKSTFQPGVSKELQVSLFQATVLLLFNGRDEWTFEDIKEATKIEEKELCRTLQSLACAKYKVLLKEPKGREVEKADKFVFNKGFKEKLFRIRICQLQMKETEKEKQQTEEEVSQDRLYQIDAALVRIMKTRKTLPHQSLIQELFAQLRFPVKAVDLKKRIASLIERDYMTRDTTDSNTYHYVA